MGLELVWCHVVWCHVYKEFCTQYIAVNQIKCGLAVDGGSCLCVSLLHCSGYLSLSFPHSVSLSFSPMVFLSPSISPLSVAVAVPVPSLCVYINRHCVWKRGDARLRVCKTRLYHIYRPLEISINDNKML